MLVSDTIAVSIPVLGLVPTSVSATLAAGQANTARINEVLAGGGIAELPPWDLTVSGDIKVPDNGGLVTPNGQARQCTLTLADAANPKCVVGSKKWIEDSSAPGQPIVIANLVIDGNAGGQSSGLGHGLAVYNYRSRIEDIRVLDTRGVGIFGDNNNSAGTSTSATTMVECAIRRCEVKDSGSHGIHWANSNTANTSATTDGWIEDCVVYNPGRTAGGHAIYLEKAGGWLVKGNHVYSTDSVQGVVDGIRLLSCYGTRVIGNQVDGFGYYGSSFSSSTIAAGIFCRPTGTGASHRPSIIADNSIITREPNAGTITQIGIRIQTSGTANDEHHWIIDGNSVYSQAASATIQGIAFSQSSSNGSHSGLVANNHCGRVGTTPFTAGGTFSSGLRVENNSFNHGTAAPTTGYWTVGTKAWKTDVAAGGSPGWVCTTAGTPGTWNTMAAVAA